MEVKIEFFAGEGFSTTFFPTLDGTQSLLVPPEEDFGSVGSIVITSSKPVLPWVAFSVEDGSFQTIAPAETGPKLIIPFAHGTPVGDRGATLLDVFNHSQTDARVMITAVEPDGTILATTEEFLVRKTGLHKDLAGLFPGGSVRPGAEFSHITVQALTNVFSSPKELAASAVVQEYGDNGLRIPPRTDEAVSSGVRATDQPSQTTLPLIVEGGGFFSVIQVINAGAVPQTVTLTGATGDGTLIAGSTNPTSLVLGAGASTRIRVADAFGMDPSTQALGWIDVSGTQPLMATAGVGTTLGGSLVLIPASTARETSFALPIRGFSREIFTGLSFMNRNGTPANLTLTFLKSQGPTVTRANLTVADGQFTRTLAELLPEVQEFGFVLGRSDVPLTITAIEGQNDGFRIANLPALAALASFEPPTQTEFLAVGTVRSEGAALPGATVNLAGTVAAAVVTDEVGTFAFRKIPAGGYTITPVATGYTFSPISISSTITDSNSRNNDFEGTLVVPEIASVEPVGILVNSPDTTVTVTGGPFIPTSEVLFEGSPLPTTLIDETRLGARFEVSRLKLAREGDLSVRNRGPAGNTATSLPVSFSVGGPPPLIDALGGVPAEVVVGSSGFDVTLTGTGFLDGAVMQVNGVARTTTFVDETSIIGSVQAEDLTTSGDLKITAINPSPTLGPSNEKFVLVLNPVAGLLKVAPDLIVARPDDTSPPVPMSIEGFNFVKGAVVLIAGVEVPTEFVNSTTLTAEIPASVVPDGGPKTVTVKNPDPVVSREPPSETLPLMVLNPVPILSSISFAPTDFDESRPERPDGEAQEFKATIILNGANLNSSTKAFFAGGCKEFEVTGSLLNSRQMVFEIPITCSSPWSVLVENAQPGGGVSASLTFTVGDSPATTPPPQLNSTNPNQTVAGNPSFDLTIFGSNFEAGAAVQLGTAALTPTSVTATQIVVPVPAILISAPGLLSLSVTNPNSGASNRLFLSVISPP